MLNIAWEWISDLDWKSELNRPSALQCLSLARIMEEALSNSIKHSRARRIQVSCTQPQSNMLLMQIEDDGIGFDPKVSQETSSLSVGLRSMAARAARAGGKFKVESAIGKGTVVEVRLPLGHTK